MQIEDIRLWLPGASLADLKSVRDAIATEYSERLRETAIARQAEEIAALEAKIALLRAGGTPRGRPRKNPSA